jgi:4-diphosphocytidyl-2-C-methyl-D-erythritol kinase
VILFPNSKINLGLHILRKRSDGYHDLETCFYPILWHDALEIIHGDDNIDFKFSSSGISLDIDPKENICYKAYRLLLADFPKLPSIKFHLHKNIPSGAGLGGGSADGAFTLLLLNEKFKLDLKEEHLLEYALQLGSDCPFFIKNKPCIATGRGEKLVQTSVDLSAFDIVLINPNIHVDTGAAFSKIITNDERPSIDDALKQPIQQWKDLVFNDFELSVFQSFPEIASIKSVLYNEGAIYASMTGSGSTVYGIFEKGTSFNLSFPKHYLIKVV